MLDKLEIYPYQRLAEDNETRTRRRRARTAPRFRFNLNLNLDLKWERLRQLRFKPEAWRQIAAAIITPRYIGMWLVAFILGRAFVLGEIFPFGFAFAAAFLGKNRTQAVGMVLFSCLGFLTVSHDYLLWSNILAMFTLVLALQYIPMPTGKRWLALPVITASLILTSKSVFLLFNQPSFYKEMIIVFEALITGVLTFVMMVANEVVSPGKNLDEFTFEDMTAFSILGVGIIIGLADITILKLSLSSILCRCGILVAAFLWGSGAGTMVGVLAGVIPSLSSQAFPQLLGLYAISGLVAGLFRNFGRLGVITGFMLGSMLLSIFIIDTHEALMGIWETGVAALLFFLLPESIKERMPLKSVGQASNTTERNEAALADEHLQELAQERMGRLAHIFEEISATFMEAQGGECPETGEKSYLNLLFDEVSQGFCKNCAIYTTCWDKDFYRTYKNFFEAFSLAESKGGIEYEDLPPVLRKRCMHPQELVGTVNQIFANLRMTEYWEGRLSESKELISSQLRGISGVIKNLADEYSLKTSIDGELRKRLLRECKQHGIRIQDIAPIREGKNQVYFRIVAPACMEGETCDVLAPAISSLVGEKYEVCEKKCPRQVGKGRCEFILGKAFGYRVVTGAAQLARERVSGDSLTVATLKDGKELLVLSDGMGVGKRAFTESRAVVNLLEELLTSGFGKDMALKTINSILLLRSPRETFATVDLCMVDLYSAETDFVKIGSAPTYIKRGQQVGAISSNSPPIGILNNLETVAEKKNLQTGDLLVMVTDGILDSAKGREDRDVWVQEFLAESNEADPQRLSDMIINRALERARGKPHDDMTVLIARIDAVS